MSFLLQTKDDGQYQQSLELSTCVLSEVGLWDSHLPQWELGLGGKAERQDGVGEGATLNLHSFITKMKSGFPFWIESLVSHNP